MFVVQKKKMVASNIKLIEVIEKYATFAPLLPGSPTSGRTNPPGTTCIKAGEVRTSVTGVPSDAACFMSSSWEILMTLLLSVYIKDNE